MKAISYSLFGYNKGRVENCFDFDSYLRGLMICLRMNRLIYRGWKTILQTDKSTYVGFKELFFGLQEKGLLEVWLNDDNAPLCEAMLWRLKPAFDRDGDTWKYSHVICRDLDSPATYRERQAVEQWIANDKCMHAITDSVSHNLPLLGGMIGVRPVYFSERVGNTWKSMMQKNTFDLSGKGSDQDFLNAIVYPLVATPGKDSITQHYCLGMGNTFLSGYYNKIEYDIDLPVELKESNSICGHIGAAGWYEGALFKFLRAHRNQFDDFLEIEKNYPKIFYWS